VAASGRLTSTLGVFIVSRGIRGFLTGLAVFVAMNVLYLALLTWTPSDSQSLGWLVLGVEFAAPLLAGFVCGRLTQQHQFVTLFVLGIAAAACLGALNYGWGALGFPGDLAGLGNVPMVIGLSLFAVVPLVVVGGAVGATLRHGAHA
jgi:hypothetical protein